MTLITRINCGTHVYLASDCQVNDRDGFKQQGKSACKSRILPDSKGFIGIAGLININGVIILDEIIDQLKSAKSISIQDCISAIDYTLSLHLNSVNDWHCIFMISLMSNGIIENHTYMRAPHLTKRISPHIIVHQINGLYLKDLNKLWGNFDYDSLWYSEINKYAYMRKTWVSNVDFNMNYMHFFHGQQLEDPDQWDIFTKPYTLLYFEFLNRGWSYQNFSAITESQWVNLLQSIYLNAHKTYTELYKNEYERSMPCSSIGDCNHILKLDQASQIVTELLAEGTCK